MVTKVWLRKLRVFRALDSADRLLVLEAIVALSVAGVLLRAVPFRWLARWLSRTPDDGVCVERLLVRVRRAVTMAAANVPWTAVCLPQAMAAKALLARRGHGSACVFGAGTDANGTLVSHAWLVSGGRIVVGAAGVRGVTPLARFG